MSWDAPWALVGLLALPVIWWVHRRLRRPRPLDLPSLMFLLDEAERSALPHGRRLDAELLLALTAAACLALGAAGPRLLGGAGQRLVRVVVAGGAPARLEGYEGRVASRLATIRSACSSGDRVLVQWEPSAQGVGSRPSTAALLGAVRSGPASLRVVLADTDPAEDPGDVLWLAVGASDATNQGIVAADVDASEDGVTVFCNVAHHGPAPVTLELRVTAAPAQGSGSTTRRVLDLPAEALRPVSVFLPERPADAGARTERIELALEAVGGGPHRDALTLDDRVTLTRAPLDVHLDDGLPAAHRARVRQALEASQGTGGVRWRSRSGDAALAVVRRGNPAAAGDGWVLALEPVPAGAVAARAAVGLDEIGRDPSVADCSTAGAEWIYAAGAERVEAGEEVVLARRGASTWPVVLRSGRRVRLAADPLRGTPAPADGPFWPLLIDNLTRLAGGRAAASAGWRVEGLLDADASRPGRSQRGSFAVERLRTAPLVEPQPAHALRVPLVLGALACLLLLWGAPLLSRRRSPPDRRRAVTAG